MNDLIVESKNPKALDSTLNAMGVVLEQDAEGSYIKYGEDQYRARSLNGDTGFLRFALTNQGYAKVVREIARDLELF